MSTVHPSITLTRARPRSLPMWLNIGSGDVPAPAPWVNCDVYPGVNPDVEMNACHTWPFDSGVAERVFMGQSIEHMDFPWGVRKAIKEACRVLAPGGQLIIITPDFQAIKAMKNSADIWRAEAKGLCRWPGDEHRWMPTRGIVLRECKRRFIEAEIVNHMNLSPDWPRGSRNPWDCCVIAQKV